MTDSFSKDVRSRMMSKIRSKDTKPEKIVRSLMHSLGLRFRLHDSKLPGSPDLVMKKFRTVVYVHGCFWHSHPGCKYATRPKSNLDYWDGKLKNNVERDKLNQKEITAMGWRSIILWECETKYLEMLQRKLETYFNQNNVIL